MPAKDTLIQFSFKDLQDHLQFAVDLEFWTIPFYMSAMYSIKDPSDGAYRLIQSVVYQEMLHLQLAANIANAFGRHPTFGNPDRKFKDYEFPVYKGDYIPHIHFALDNPDPREIFDPYSPEIGPFDQKRLNAMCLIEYPEWDTHGQPDPRGSIEDYGSIGEFYDAVEMAAANFADRIKGGKNQVDLFGRFYHDLSLLAVSEDGVAGLKQVMKLITVINDQGEGQTEGEADIPKEYRNTADDPSPELTHFTKFNSLRKSLSRPEEFPKTWPTPDTTDPERLLARRHAQEKLRENFKKFKCTMQELFGSGQVPADFAVQMATLGGNILRCWQTGVAPDFNFRIQHKEGV